MKNHIPNYSVNIPYQISPTSVKWHGDKRGWWWWWRRWQ